MYFMNKEIFSESQYGIRDFNSIEGLIFPIQSDKDISANRTIELESLSGNIEDVINRVGLKEIYNFQEDQGDTTFYYPFIHSLYEDDDIPQAVNADSKILVGRVMPNFTIPNNLTEDDIHKMLDDNEYLDYLKNPVKFTDKKVKVLRIRNMEKFKDNSDSRYSMEISFKNKNSGLIYYGFNGYEVKDELVELSASLNNKREERYIIFTGDVPSEFNISFTKHGSVNVNGKKPDLSYEEVSLNEILISAFDKAYSGNELITSYDENTKLRLIYEALEKTHMALINEDYDLDNINVSLNEAFYYMEREKRYSYLKIENLKDYRNLEINRKQKVNYNVDSLGNSDLQGITVIASDSKINKLNIEKTKISLENFKPVLYYDQKQIDSKDYERVSEIAGIYHEIPEDYDLTIVFDRR